MPIWFLSESIAQPEFVTSAAKIYNSKYCRRQKTDKNSKNPGIPQLTNKMARELDLTSAPSLLISGRIKFA